MGAIDFRLFANPEELKRIERRNLLRLLYTHQSYLRGRDLELPQEGSQDEIDYRKLARILFLPTDETPTELIHALNLVREMATEDAMDGLIEAAAAEGLSLGGPESSPIDVAVRAYLEARDILERKHAEQFLIRPRSYEYFRAAQIPNGPFKDPDRLALRALEEILDDWFEQKKRGRSSRVDCFLREKEVWFLVQHGDPYRREGTIKGGKRTSIFYRPEKNDVLVYSPERCEMWANARSKGEKRLYREKIGEYFFGDGKLFSGKNKFTLEPLRMGETALACSDIEGIERVRLKEVETQQGALTKIFKAADLFAVLPYGIRDPEISRAKFEVRFSDTAIPRKDPITLPNKAQYTRDSDSLILEEWLARRGFVVPRVSDGKS